MKKNTEQCIEVSKSLIDSFLSGNRINYWDDFSEYSLFYRQTTESIGSYLPLIDSSIKESALTVLSSGDHVLNLVCAGIMNIDTFDTNKLTEFYALGIKRALVLSSTYEEYFRRISSITYNDITFDEERELIESLFPNMEDKYKEYWRVLLDYAFQVQKDNEGKCPLLRMLSRQDISYIAGYNLFSANPESYNRLKERLRDAKVSFTCCNATDLNQFFSNQYDIIMLSNILNYFYKEFGEGWKYNLLREYEKKILQLLSPDGVALVAYFYDLGEDWVPPKEWSPIRDSGISLSEINGKHEKIIPFIGRSRWGDKKNQAVLALRKKGWGDNNG